MGINLVVNAVYKTVWQRQHYIEEGQNSGSFAGELSKWGPWACWQWQPKEEITVRMYALLIFHTIYMYTYTLYYTHCVYIT